MRSVIGVRPRSAVALVLAAAIALVMFFWPLFIGPGSALTDENTAPLIFALCLPLVLAVVLVEITEGGLDVKAVAMLGVLTALGAAVRPLGAGAAGFESVFFVLILGGRVFGPAFGFLLGCTMLFASALLTGGVGPWLPYQMLAAAWVGLGAGLLPRVRGRAEVVLLIAYGVVAAFGYGFLMNLSFWPFTLGPDTGLSFVPGDSVAANLHRFVLFTLATSMGWDLGRAVFTGILLGLTASAMLGALRRASRRAAFGAPVRFGDAARPGRALLPRSPGEAVPERSDR